MLNFSAGPSALPLSVKSALRAELNKPISVFEKSHKSDEVRSMWARAQSLLRNLLIIPSTHEIILCQGGGRVQAAQARMMFDSSIKGMYVDTGFWSNWAYQEACKFNQNNSLLPKSSSLTQTIDCSGNYIYYTHNETFTGSLYQLEVKSKIKKIPVIIDATSSLLCEPIDMAHSDLVFAGCQKSLGLPGNSLVIFNPQTIPNNFHLPTGLNYHQLAADQSFTTTPSVIQMWLIEQLCLWVEKQGITKLQERRRRFAEQIYEIIDNTPFFTNRVSQTERSPINITFEITHPKIASLFEEQALAHEYFFFKGHPMLGGYRLSLYNALLEQEIEKFASFFNQFAFASKELV